MAYLHLQEIRKTDTDPTMGMFDKEEFVKKNIALLEKLKLIDSHDLLEDDEGIVGHELIGRPAAKLVTFNTAGGRHAIVIKRIDDKNYEYYDPTGNTWDEFPKEAQDTFEFPGGTTIHSSIYEHQTDRPNCLRHAITRLCLSQLSNDEYNLVIQAGMKKYGLSADGVVEGITNNTVELGPIPKAEPQQSLKFGGIVYGRK